MGWNSLSLALTGSGGSGVMTIGGMLLEAAGRAGLYGIMTRSSGPQIRGGEAAALLRLAACPIDAHEDSFDAVIALDPGSLDRFLGEIPVRDDSLIISDPEGGRGKAELPDIAGQRIDVRFKKLAKRVPDGRPNMVALGVAARLVGLPDAVVLETVDKVLGARGVASLEASRAGVGTGFSAAGELPALSTLPGRPRQEGQRWNISGNEAAGLGAIRGGVRFVAAYPITPATEVLEWLATALPSVGGVLVQAEDELASINQCIGASFGGVPALTATSGPGFALMTEAIGLAVCAEVPVVVVNVMRCGPSTGIPTKSEQSDLNIALSGLHGDAPHVVVAPMSITDCIFTTQWAAHLAESMQVPVIVLSDQSLGLSRAIVDRPAEISFMKNRKVPETAAGEYRRYAVAGSSVSPMAIPGQLGGQYTADGLEHTEAGAPSSLAADHAAQLEKRQQKLMRFSYGDHWAQIEGAGDTAIICWGATCGPVREAVARLRHAGRDIRQLAIRLLTPERPREMAHALEGVERILVVEQSHSRQFYRYLRAAYDLPGEVRVFNRPGPLPFRPREIIDQLGDWCGGDTSG